MKNVFNKDHHQCWVELVCWEQVAYACRDAYACYALWNQILLIHEGMLEAKERKVMKVIQARIQKIEEGTSKLKEEAQCLKKFR